MSGLLAFAISEHRKSAFIKKTKDLHAIAIDYDKSSEQAQLFFQKMQNKMLWAVTEKPPPS